MKKIILIPLVMFALHSLSQTVAGFYSNGELGKKVTLHGLGTSSTYFLLPNDSTWNFDSTKVVTDVTLNITSDSIYIYKGGAFVRAIKVGGTTSGGSGTGWLENGNAATAGSETGSFIGTTNNTSFRFRTNNIERAYLDSTGTLNLTKGTYNVVSTMSVPLRLMGGYVSAINPSSDLVLALQNTTSTGKTWLLDSKYDGKMTFVLLRGNDYNAASNGTAYLILDSATKSVSTDITIDFATQKTRMGSAIGSGYGGIWLGSTAASYSFSNYTLLSDGTGETYLNTPNAGTPAVIIRVGNANKFAVTSTGTIWYTTSTPATPASGTVVEWYDGTNKRWKKSDGTTGIIY